jgi:hypothetical protein
MHLILMLSQSLISYPLWTRLGKWSGMGLWRRASRRQPTITKFQHAVGNWEWFRKWDRRTWCTVSGVRWSSPLRGEGLVRHMSESFRDRDYTPMTPTLLRGPFLSSLRISRIRALRIHDHLDASALLFYICSFTITSFFDLAPFSPCLLCRLLSFSGSAPEMPRAVHCSCVLSAVLGFLRRLFYLLT